MMPPRLLRAVLLALPLVAACENAGQSLAFPELATGQIAVGIYLDRDASQTQTAGDTVVPGVRVALLAAGGRDTLRVATSGADGVARFLDVPIGTYRVRVDREALGDSLPVVVGDTGTLRILAFPDSAAAGRAVRLSYQEVTIAEARALPAGRRVFVRGTVLSGLQFFRDSSTHVVAGTGYLRITGATHAPGRTGNNVGDSIIVLGRTGTARGQPVLQGGLVQTLGAKLAPIPLPVTLAEAITALGGTLDAALVELPTATITDTATVTPDFRVRIAVGSDTMTVILDQLLNVQRQTFGPGRLINVRGVLVPTGTGTWLLKPRPVAGEILLTNPTP